MTTTTRGNNGGNNRRRTESNIEETVANKVASGTEKGLTIYNRIIRRLQRMFRWAADALNEAEADPTALRARSTAKRVVRGTVDTAHVVSEALNPVVTGIRGFVMMLCVPLRAYTTVATAWFFSTIVADLDKAIALKRVRTTTAA